MTDRWLRVATFSALIGSVGQLCIALFQVGQVTFLAPFISLGHNYAIARIGAGIAVVPWLFLLVAVIAYQKSAASPGGLLGRLGLAFAALGIMCILITLAGYVFAVPNNCPPDLLCNLYSPSALALLGILKVLGAGGALIMCIGLFVYGVELALRSSLVLWGILFVVLGLTGLYAFNILYRGLEYGASYLNVGMVTALLALAWSVSWFMVFLAIVRVPFIARFMQLNTAMRP